MVTMQYTGNRSAVLPSIHAEWRKALRSEPLARCRGRVCQLRASARARSSASEPSIASTISGVLEITELKAREAWLGLHKTLLKISGVFK
jgi:hypothetical protein